ncbi:hypothetical protein B0H14DRAFT_2695500 [Mycena olivaceomarginata]|nr:hypothetical protein B0H14DRAFT_2695500 [Mycena olivaceomarginata]
MYATRSNQSSPESSRSRKKHVHAECGEPIKGHRRVNGVLVCRGTDTEASAMASKLAMLMSPETSGFSEVLYPSQPRELKTLEDLEFVLKMKERGTLQLLREGNTRGFSGEIPGTLRGLELQRRHANANASWADVAITVVEAFRDLCKFVLLVVVLLLCIFAYTTRNDAAPTPASACFHS